MTAVVWDLLVAGTASVCGLMLLLWLIHLPLRNASVVDPGWAGGLALLGVIYAAMGGGYPLRTVLIASMALLWGLRLAFYLLFTRVIGHPEEGRYVQLRREWGGNLPLKFLLFFQFQALLCVFLATPFLGVANDAREQEKERQSQSPEQGHRRDQQGAQRITVPHCGVNHAEQSQAPGPSRVHDGRISQRQVNQPQQQHQSADRRRPGEE